MIVKLAPPRGFEPLTLRLEGGRSILLSYGGGTGDDVSRGDQPSVPVASTWFSARTSTSLVNT